MKIADNVHKFLDKAAALHGEFQQQSFSQELYSNCIDNNITSPIEQMFLIACHAMCASRYLEVNPGPSVDRNGNLCRGYGVFISTQYPVGKYKVDFLLSQNEIGPSEILTPVIVELDGHDFHDKDKRQRSYEKSRDRYLVKEGFRVLHFTGSDVVSDPFKVAFEALSMIGFDALGGCEYNPKDPMDMGV